jgi:hypothetical protein
MSVLRHWWTDMVCWGVYEARGCLQVSRSGVPNWKKVKTPESLRHFLFTHTNITNFNSIKLPTSKHSKGDDSVNTRKKDAAPLFARNRPVLTRSLSATS